MTACTFFGHKECYGLDTVTLKKKIEELILQGVCCFYVGHQGDFDSLALSCLQALKKTYSHIQIFVVLAYLPTKQIEHDPCAEYSIFPEGIEMGPPKFAIERRNRWMIDKSEYCLCYVNHTWGGAYKFAQRAKNKGRLIFNLGTAKL